MGLVRRMLRRFLGAVVRFDDDDGWDGATGFH